MASTHKELVEKVAEAVRETNRTTSGLTFSDLSNAMARAALAAVYEALKEPSAEMIAAWLKYYSDEQDECGFSVQAVDVFRAMLSASPLKEPDGGRT